MQIKDFSEKEPRLDLFEYFEGESKAWGVVHDRFGNLRREFTVDIAGEIQDNLLVLTEDFIYSDGETQQRIWKISKIDEHHFEGVAEDVEGIATGQSYGNALNWKYSMNLKINDRTMLVRFDDWMYLQNDKRLINRAVIRKWGFVIAEVSIFFEPVD